MSTCLETKVCTRCGGSGKYSFNMMDGDRCYGCRGTGKIYTKRGKAALDYLIELRTVSASEVVVGDLVKYEDLNRTFFLRVSFIGTYLSMPGFLKIAGLYKGTEYRMIMSPTGKVIKGFTAEEKQEQLKKAYAYQDSLTIAGTVRKRVKAL